MKIKILFSVLLLVLFSCSKLNSKQKLQGSEKSLKIDKQKTSLKKSIKGYLVHIVFVKLKPDVDKQILLHEIKKIEEIESIEDLKVGVFKELDDPRSLSNYQLALEIVFKDSLAYENYKKHPIHIALKQNTKQFLADIPSTYNFIVE